METGLIFTWKRSSLESLVLTLVSARAIVTTLYIEFSIFAVGLVTARLRFLAFTGTG